MSHISLNDKSLFIFFPFFPLGAFTIDEVYSGTIRVAGTLNKESVGLYNLTVRATDDGQLVGEASLSSTVRLRLFSPLNV